MGRARLWQVGERLVADTLMVMDTAVQQQWLWFRDVAGYARCAAYDLGKRSRCDGTISIAKGVGVGQLWRLCD